MKLEVTFGTYTDPAAADIIEPVVGELEYTPNVEMFTRELINESLSPVAQIPGERSASISFTTELKGSGAAGTAPTHLSVPFRACGMGETIVAVTSVTYAPISTAQESASIKILETDETGVAMRKRLAGGRGSFSIDAQKGQPVMVAFEFQGKYFEPDQVAGALSPSPSSGLTPVPFLGVTFSLLGVSTLLVQAVTMDIANEVSMRNDINDASGNIGASIVSRQPVATVNPEQALVATINPWNKLTTAAEGVLSFVLGSSAGNIVTFSAPKAQIVEVSDGDRDTLAVNDLSLQLNGSAVGGNDEFSIAFT